MRPVLAAIPPGVTSLTNKAGGGKFLSLAINSPKPPCSGRSRSTSMVFCGKGNVVIEKETRKGGLHVYGRYSSSNVLLGLKFESGGLLSQCLCSTRSTCINLLRQPEIMPEVSCGEEVSFTVGSYSPGVTLC